MTTVGMIGLGQMGSAMAERLLDQGKDVVGHDPDAERAGRLADLGGRVEENAVAVARSSDGPLLLNVQTVDQAWSVWQGLAADMAGRTLVVMGTFGVEPLERLAVAVDAAGGLLVDAPHTGSVPGARTGTLVFFLAGAGRALAQAEATLSVLGSTRRVIGTRPGLGQAMKLVNAVGLAFNMSATAELERIAAMNGIDPESALRWIDGCSGSNWLSARMPDIAALIVDHNVDNLEKDLRAALAPAGPDLPVTAEILATVRASWLGRVPAARP